MGDETPEQPEASPGIQALQLHTEPATLPNGTMGVLLRFQMILDPASATRIANGILEAAKVAELGITIAPTLPTNGNGQVRILRPPQR